MRKQMPASTATDRRGEDLRAPVGVLVAVALAWLVLALGFGHDHLNGGLQHGSHPTAHGAPAPAMLDPIVADQLGVLLRRASGWAVMIVAMMLPPAIPLLRVIGRLADDRRHRRQLVGVATVTFLTSWTVAGLGYLVADQVARRLLSANPWASENPALLAGFVCLVAAAWQFSPAKNACLTACRSPVAVVMTNWGRRGPLGDTAVVALRYALVCIGCCWALMAIGLVVGVPALPLMVLLAVVMAAERMVPTVRRFVPAVALGCALLGVGLLTGLIPPAWPT